MHWLMQLAIRVLPDLMPAEDSSSVARREVELRQRFERLTREVEVIQRTEDAREDRR